MAGKIEVTVNKNNNQVILTQNTTNVVQVNTPGPRGIQGATGPQHDPNSITGSLHLTGSLIVSSSYVDFTNATAISGSTFSGSFVGDGSGITGVTAEWDGSHTGTATFTGNITASGDISSSGVVTALTGSFGRLEGLSPITVGDSITFTLPVTASGNISSSGIIYGTELRINNKSNTILGSGGDLQIGGHGGNWTSINIGRGGMTTQNIGLNGPVTASSTITATGNISSSGEIYGKEFNSDGVDANSGFTLLSLTDKPIISAVSNNLHIGSSISNDPIVINSTAVTMSGNISSSGTITANAFVGGGSGITGVVSSSYAVTASYALNSSGGSVPAGTLSSSAQIATEISGAFTVASGGFSTRVTTLEAGGGGSGIFNQTGSYYTTANDLIITGSLIISGSTQSTASLVVHGSGSTIFEVKGDVGSLFSIDDSLSGSLLAVSDISGIPQFEVFSDGKITLGAVPTSLYTTAQIASTTATTQSVYSISTSSYDAAFFDYVVTSASNMRAGNIMSVWDASSNLNYTETTTTDIGDTSNIQLLVNISQSRAHLHTVCSSASWKIKTIIKSI